MQEDIIMSVLKGHDTLALLPTGGFMVAGSVGLVNTAGMDAIVARLKPDGMFDSTFGNNGIVIDSIPEKEYEETLTKAKALINAIAGKIIS